MTFEHTKSQVIYLLACFNHTKITINSYNIKMNSEISQGAYFQPSQDGPKARSNRKKVYKYTDEQSGAEPSFNDRQRPYQIRHNVNDFSFQDRSDKLRTPKREIYQSGKKQQAYSPIGGKDSNKKKDFDQRINKIENLNDKISSLLKMVPKGSNQNQQRLNRIKEISLQNQPSATIQYSQRQKFSANISDNEYSPYRKMQEERNRVRRTDERKKNFSYLQQLNNDKPKNKIQNDGVDRQYKYSKAIDQRRQSSPILKYRRQVQQETPKQGQQLQQDENNPPVISQSILKVNNQTEKKSSQIRYKYTGTSALLEKYRQQVKNKQKEKQLKYNKQNEQLQKKEKAILNNVELDLKINEIKNRIIEDSPLKQKNYNQSLQRQLWSRQDQILQTDIIGNQPTLFLMAKKISLLIDLDIICRKIRQSFEQYKNQKKWEMLRGQLKARGVYIDEKQLKEIMKISIHQKNPFGDKVEAFPLNGAKDLAKLFAQTEKIWNQELQKYISLDDLARQNFDMRMIDLNRKGYISIEDLVCFVNLHGQKFYRSRDLAQLFRRFLTIQGKTLEKNISDGIGYKTLMGKLCK